MHILPKCTVLACRSVQDHKTEHCISRLPKAWWQQGIGIEQACGMNQADMVSCQCTVLLKRTRSSRKGLAHTNGGLRQPWSQNTSQSKRAAAKRQLADKDCRTSSLQSTRVLSKHELQQSQLCKRIYKVCHCYASQQAICCINAICYGGCARTVEYYTPQRELPAATATAT